MPPHASTSSRLAYETNYHSPHSQPQAGPGPNGPRTFDTELSGTKPGKTLPAKRTARKSTQSPWKSNNAAQVAPSITVATSPPIIKAAEERQYTAVSSSPQPPLKKPRLSIEKDDANLKSLPLSPPINGAKHPGSSVNGTQSGQKGPLPDPNTFSLRPEKKSNQPTRNRGDNDMRSSATTSAREAGQNASYSPAKEIDDTPAKIPSFGHHVNISERSVPAQVPQNPPKKQPSIFRHSLGVDTIQGSPLAQKDVSDPNKQQKPPFLPAQLAQYRTRQGRSPEPNGKTGPLERSRERGQSQVHINGSSHPAHGGNHQRWSEPEARVQSSEASARVGSREGDHDGLMRPTVPPPRKYKVGGQNLAPKTTMSQIVDLTSDLTSDKSLSPGHRPPRSKPSEALPYLGANRSPDPLSVVPEMPVVPRYQRPESVIRNDAVGKNSDPPSIDSDEPLRSRRPRTVPAANNVGAGKDSDPVSIDSDEPLAHRHLRKKHGPGGRVMGVVPEDLGRSMPEPKKQVPVENVTVDKLDAYIYGPLNEPNRPGSALYDAPPPVSTRPAIHFGYFDPRVHWTTPRAQIWYRRKQTEIAARGNRKSESNFKRAAAGYARRRADQRSAPELPKRVQATPGWTAALDELDAMAEEFREKQRVKDRRKKKGKDKAVDLTADYLVKGYEWATKNDGPS